MCSDSPWSWLSVSMAQWMMVGFAVYGLIWLIVLLPALKPTNKSH
jgi:disulfide bond formation protein DsbB